MRVNVAIFCFCLLIYWLNGQYAMATGDSWPTSLLAFNLLENHTLHLDFLKSSNLFHELRPPYFLLESRTGHLTSAYPIGTALLTFPLYLIFYPILKIQAALQGNPTIDLANASFFLTRLFYEKVAATIVGALTTVCFYRAVLLKFSQRVAIWTTIIFAFATSMWVIGSQALWQHGSTALLLTFGLWCLLKANRVSDDRKRIYLLWVGLVCGLLPGIRPTAVLFSITMMTYCCYVYRARAIWIMPGLLAHLPTLCWNLYYFDNPQGSYEAIDQALDGINVQTYSFAPKRLFQGLFGLLVSTSRGLLSLSPIVLYGLVGIKPLRQEYQQDKSRQDAQLIIWLTISITILFFSYCAYLSWWGGACYGSRFLVDALPIICYLVAYGLSTQKLAITIWSMSWQSWLFKLVLIYSILIQAIGAFDRLNFTWDFVPPIQPLTNQSRFWDWQDSQVARSFWRLVHNWQGLSRPPKLQPSQFQGKILAVLDEQNLPAASLIVGKSLPPIVLELSGKQLKANVQNTGNVLWHGYRAGLSQGEVQVRGRLFNTFNQMVQETPFYIASNTPPGGIAEAIGLVTFPDISGRYKLVLDIVSTGGEALANSQWRDNAGQPITLTIQSQSWRQYQQEIRLNSEGAISTAKTNAAKTNAIVQIPLQVTNKSNFIWRSQGLYPMSLSFRWAKPNGEWLPSSEQPVLPGTMLQTPLLIGRQASLIAQVKMPAKPGQYQLKISMVELAYAWLDDLGSPGVSLPFTVQP